MKSTFRLKNVLNLTTCCLILLYTAGCSSVSGLAVQENAYPKKSLVGDWNLVGVSTETYRDGTLVSKEDGAPEAPASNVLFVKDGWVFFPNKIGAWEYAGKRLVIDSGFEKRQSYELLSLSRSAMVLRWEYLPEGDAASGYQTYIIGEYAR